MSLFDHINTFYLLATARKIWGPYERQDGRKHYIIQEDDGTKRTVPDYRFLMEEHLGRRLDTDQETVDHKDSDKNNNDISNLQILPRKEHSTLDTRRVKHVDFNCAWCEKPFQRSPRLVRDKAKKNKAGPFCSRQCSGAYSRSVQMGKSEKLPPQPYIESTYYKKKNVAELADYIIAKYGRY